MVADKAARRQLLINDLRRHSRIVEDSTDTDMVHLSHKLSSASLEGRWCGVVWCGVVWCDARQRRRV